jgi:hypothetical protein
MRFVLPALAAALLAVVPAQASQILLPPAGQYIGKADNHANIIFSLNLDDLDNTKVVDFFIHGHKKFSSSTFHYGHNTYGWFRYESRHGSQLHVWAHWLAQYGHVAGGYSYIDGSGHRVTHHWAAAADGF